MNDGGERTGMPLRVERGQCRGCGRSILWCRTVAEKKMPLDPDPVKIVTADPATGTGIVTTGYVSHFATCPKADSFRKKT